jgi:predicted nucleic acid-binding Zn ribbon protein
MIDKPIEKCPKCHKKVKRLIGAGAGIIFKGSGFYATDYRKKPKNNSSVCPKANQGCGGCQHP